MNRLGHRIRGISLVSVIIAVVLLGAATAGIIQYSSSVGNFRRELDTKVQEDSYRLFQHELALSGANPAAMSLNPLAGSTTGSSPMPTIAFVSTASRDQAGSAKVDAYSAAPDIIGRSASMGYRIAATGTAVIGPAGSPLLPPTFRVSGLVAESEFAPGLTNLILPNPANPPGTVYRYTLDGSTPTAASPIWNTASSLPAAPLPGLVRAAAFNSDPSSLPSSIVSDTLARGLAINYSRSSGGFSTSFTYAEVTGSTNNILLGISNAPPGTAIYYTYDGSTPTTSSHLYTGGFQVPLFAWSATIPLQAIAVTGSDNISAAPLALTLAPSATALPPPAFGAPGGTATAVLVSVTDAVAGVTIRYDIDEPLGGSSPTGGNGVIVSVLAP